MKVCLLNDSFPPTIDGVANATLNYARVIRRELGECVVATPEYPGAEDDYDFPVVRYSSLNTTKLVGYRAGVPEPSTLYKLAAEKPDIIHSHCPVSSTILAHSLREITGAPVVLTYHTKFDVDIRNAIKGELMQETLIRALVSTISSCDEVWTVSRGAGENLESLGYTGPWRVMENGVDFTRGRASEEQVRAATGVYDLPEGLPVFLFVGRLMWYKGIRIILDGLARRMSGGADFRMVFVGSGGDEEEIRRYVASCGLGEKVIFTGAIRDREALRAWYTRADLMLFPSTFDTNGLVVREAAACGLASVLVAGSCAAEGVADGDTGLLISEDGESLAAALDAINTEKCREIGRRAQEELYLSWDESVHRAWERYGEILSDWNPASAKKRGFMPVADMVGSVLEFHEMMERVKQKAGEAFSPRHSATSRAEKRGKEK